MEVPKVIKRNYRVMTWELAVAEFRMRDQGTFLGFLWTLLHPLIYFFVLHAIFRNWMGHHIDNFPLYLIIGIVQWSFFVGATSNSIPSIIRQGSFIKNINFPREVLVYSSVLSVVFSHILELLILIVFWLTLGHSIDLTGLILIPILVLNIYLGVGIGFMLATIGVFFLDIERIWGIFTSVGLFLTPIFYSLDLLDPDKRAVILLNPMTHIITATRSVLIDNVLPEWKGLAYVFVIATVILLIGYNLFKKYEGFFAEKI